MIVRSETRNNGFPRLTNAEVMARYAGNKPDTRYPFAIETVKEDSDKVVECLDLSMLPSGIHEEKGVKRERLLREHNGSTALGRIGSQAIRRIEEAGLQSKYRIDGESGKL